jgi:hypothetical protein
MPMFFFEVAVNGVSEPGRIGVEFPDMQAARREAIVVATEIATEPDGPQRDIVVRTFSEKKALICTVRLSLNVEE